ncbi:hypothetical protein RDWZM_004377 [Blomia tropicalis]|uniref:Uncharacterized protein n=1 Tax=Blomia tropicalis TaxID=40697 RepID=A0A9Q0MHJ0_BLOTA|nr:hypothetical protein RDWZM_004377 [Blomia tropicalis]
MKFLTKSLVIMCLFQLLHCLASGVTNNPIESLENEDVGHEQETEKDKEPFSGYTEISPMLNSSTTKNKYLSKEFLIKMGYGIGGSLAAGVFLRQVYNLLQQSEVISVAPNISSHSPDEDSDSGLMYSLIAAAVVIVLVVGLYCVFRTINASATLMHDEHEAKEDGKPKSNIAGSSTTGTPVANTTSNTLVGTAPSSTPSTIGTK